jgi:Putative transposase
LGLERLCRYGLRPPLALERLAFTEGGRVRYRMKRTFSDGTRELVLLPTELLRRLAALVQPP